MRNTAPVRMIAVDLDGTLLGADSRVGPRNRAAIAAAEAAGIEVVVATGRRHTYAMHVLREHGLRDDLVLVSSNGAVVRTTGATLLDRTRMPPETARWLVGHLDEFRNALVVTFDTVGPDGEDGRGALVVEDMAELHTSIGKWMEANERYVLHVQPIEDALRAEPPIQMMLCGTVERMRAAEARMLASGRVSAVGEGACVAEITLNRTEYPERDLSIVDILPAGCSKGTALLQLARARGFGPENIMAIGDNWNDLSMLEVAGWPVLMANAPLELHERARGAGWLTTAAHDADGVAEIIDAVLAGDGVPALTAEEYVLPEPVHAGSN